MPQRDQTWPFLVLVPSCLLSQSPWHLTFVYSLCVVANITDANITRIQVNKHVRKLCPFQSMSFQISEAIAP